MHWPLSATWELSRDIAITGTGLWIIWRQVLYSPLHPSGLLLGTGLALTVPSVAAHVKALLPGTEDSAHFPAEHGGGSSSSSSSPAQRLRRSPSSPPPGSTDDGVARFFRRTAALR